MILKATFRTPHGRQLTRLASSVPGLLIEDSTYDHLRPEFVVIGASHSVMRLIGALADEGEDTLYDVSRV